MSSVGMRHAAGERLPVRDVAKFTAAVALLAIFWDAAVGHGLTWENDPYWTYWVTKTFLIATIFGLGTAWFGIGVGRGAVITAVHTLVLTIYYWTLSPIGLPSAPDWLDLEHTWLTGVPIHFGVIYLGYLSALWLWRRRAQAAAEPTDDSVRTGVSALVAGLAIVVLAGGLSSLALLDFPGVTWFVVRLLITVPFLLLWWAAAGRDRVAAVVGGGVLAFIWATYSQFVGPLGLPDLPLRIFKTAPPPATLRWLDYKELWAISLPIYIVVMVVVLVIASGGLAVPTRMRRGAVATACIAALLLAMGSTVGPEDRGHRATLRASGSAQVETGPPFSSHFAAGNGNITIIATDMGGRVTPLQPHDQLSITANLQAGGHAYQVVVAKPMVDDPLGRFTTWWGVGFDVWHHGKSGIGTTKLPPTHSELAAFGVGNLSVDGQLVAVGVPVHVMTMPNATEENKMLEIDVGDPALGSLPGVPAGHLRAQWASYVGHVSKGPKTARYLIG
ncbi:MAG TPA: hypothetical protein VF660_02470, partial [Actinomycetota bacterium]